MTRWLPILLGIQALLSAMAGLMSILGICSGCVWSFDAKILLGPLGALFYLLLWVHVRRQKPGRLLAAAIGAAAGMHLLLLIEMIRTHAFCVWCLAAAGVALLLLVPMMLFSRFRLHTLAPFGVVLLLTVQSWTSSGASPLPTLHLVIYESPDCHYCTVLRSDVLPELQKAFPDRLRFEFRDARPVDWIRYTPTILIRHPQRSKLLEGLPSTAYLGELIAARLTPKENP